VYTSKLPCLMARLTTTLIATVVIGGVSASVAAADVRTDSPDPAFGLSSTGLMFDASVLPTPWWVLRHEESSDDISSWSDSSEELELFTPSLGLKTDRLGRLDTGGRQRLWGKGWTLTSRAARLGSREFNPGPSWSGVSFDLKRHLVDSQTNNGSLAFGLGWTFVDAANGAVASPRFSLEGRIGISKRWSLYGQSAWLADVGEFSDGTSGDTLEAGLYWQPTPGVALRAGWRRHRLRLGADDAGDSGRSESSGFVFGAGWRW